MIKTLFYITFASFLVTMGCKKKDEVGQQVSYTGSQQVNFNNYMDDNGNFGYHKVDLALIDSFINVNLEVKLTNSIGGATNDISIYFTKVDALVSDYNVENGTTLEAVSSASQAVNFDFSAPVVLKKGTRIATVTMRVNAARFDLNKQNALGIAILKVVGAELNSGSESKLVLEFGARNMYDGIYSLKGSILRSGFPAQTGAVAPYEMPLFTTGANSVEFYQLQRWADASPVGINYPVLTVNPSTNAVTITSNPPITPPVTTTTGYNSRYVPATKTFYISFYWNGTPTSRLCTDTLTYLRSR